ncbi:MAG TPA: CopG family transcriptional regulator [Spirochaetota bacterium]|jgi:metal-responsive CopG/Arc/MetJ family transcriptional regulator|nr:MAG: hypothetical protein BWX91_00419 [Spirochaetes bacterium ADurb.Bin133]HNZ27815.1 CopG family transcriptional regulator [Spirochaetota bacterium]HPY86455.1 CopG family transcriptional regulator [Spirochaetota bacterium]HQH31463.1 CopG family transcriptional regulator [Spirochaetota bacterium]
MKRTQIYLDEEMFDYLETESKLHSKSISELIRESIKEKIQGRNRNLLKNMKKVFGIWKNHKFDVDEYISDLRKDRHYDNG